jgi:ATP-dependent Clp protease ATP-binding subunit ClpB
MKKERKKRRKKRLPHIPVDHYFCTHCKKEHYKGLVHKIRYAKHYIMFRQRAESKLTEKIDIKVKELPPVKFDGKEVALDVDRRSEIAGRTEKFIKQRVVGQDYAVASIVNMTAMIDADICDPYKPRGTYLFLGPTGVGKTRIVEAMAEYYFGSRKKMIKINCGELATMFSSKKFGSRIFNDENVLLKTRSGKQLGLILFDEIEKSSRLLYKFLMGILDRAVLTVDDQEIDLSHVIVCMTSNLGANEIMEIVTKAKNKITDDVQSKMRHAALDAARQRFTPEFFNRLDEVVVFNPLLRDTLYKIVGLEINNIEQRLIAHDIRIQCTDLATEYILKEGTDVRYGARKLRRTLEEIVVQPIAHMITSGVLKSHTKLRIAKKDGKLDFRKIVKEK